MALLLRLVMNIYYSRVMRVKVYFDFESRNYSDRDESEFITLDVAHLPQTGTIFHFHPILEDLERVQIPDWKIQGYQLESNTKEEIIEGLLSVPWYVSNIYYVVDPMRHVEYYIELSTIY